MLSSWQLLLTLITGSINFGQVTRSHDTNPGNFGCEEPSFIQKGWWTWRALSVLHIVFRKWDAFSIISLEIQFGLCIIKDIIKNCPPTHKRKEIGKQHPKGLCRVCLLLFRSYFLDINLDATVRLRALEQKTIHFNFFLFPKFLGK